MSGNVMFLRLTDRQKTLDDERKSHTRRRHITTRKPFEIKVVGDYEFDEVASALQKKQPEGC
jgi:hypothetical protein